jgi:glycogen synthase
MMPKLKSIGKNIYTLATEHPFITEQKKLLAEIDTKSAVVSKRNILKKISKNNILPVDHLTQKFISNFYETSITRISENQLEDLKKDQNNILNEHNNNYKKASSAYAILSILTFAGAAATHLFAGANNPEISRVKTGLFGVGCITAISSSVAGSFDRSAIKNTKEKLFESQSKYIIYDINLQISQLKNKLQSSEEQHRLVKHEKEQNHLAVLALKEKLELSEERNLLAANCIADFASRLLDAEKSLATIQGQK